MQSWPGVLARFIVHRWTRYVLSWLVGLTVAAVELDIAWHMYDSPRTGDPTSERRDSNFGHTFIDFGGQWLTAHLVATGRGRELYAKQAQRETAEAAYPRDDEPPNAKKHDAENLMNWLMDAADDGGPAISGPLYPPTHAVMFAPLGVCPPRQAYRIAQVTFLLTGWLAGLAITGISRGRIWWPLAATLVMAFPGFAPSLHLAQNSGLSLAILMVGWWCASRGWDVAGGLVWGLLAYKPVWAAAFLLVPLLTRRWRMFLAMIAGGLAFALATIPIVGVESWWHWLRIGRAAAEHYKVDQNWIFLSRDLLGIPRRWMLDFDQPTAQRGQPGADVAGWALWATVLLSTAVIAWRRRQEIRPADGYGSAFVAIAAWSTCFHFIYYDSLLAVLPVTMLIADPQRFVRPIILAVSPAPPGLARYFSPRPMSDPLSEEFVRTAPRTAAVLNSFVLTALAALLVIGLAFPGWDVGATVSVGALERLRPLTFSTGQHGTPWETFVLLALWVYCGVRVLMRFGDDDGGPRPPEPLVVT